MVPYLKTLIVSFFLGLALFSLGWYVFVHFGLLPSIGAAILIIGFAWFVGHQNGWIYNPPGKPWIDMGWAIAASVMAWAWVKYHANPVEAIPMIVLISCGAFLGALIVFLCKPFLRKILMTLILNDNNDKEEKDK